MGKYLGRMLTSGSTGKINKASMVIGPFGQARQQGCFWEHSMTFYDILPWLSNIHEARLTNDFVSLFKDGIRIINYKIE